MTLLVLFIASAVYHPVEPGVVMVAESYHVFQERGVWIIDSRLEIFLHVLLEVQRETYAEHRWLEDRRADFELQAQGIFPDMMSLELDALLTCDTRVAIFLALLEDTSARIARQGTELDLEWLHQVRSDKPLLPRQTRPMPTSELVEVKARLEGLITGTSSLES